jgi:hypothetical protein
MPCLLKYYAFSFCIFLYNIPKNSKQIAHNYPVYVPECRLFHGPSKDDLFPLTFPLPSELSCIFLNASGISLSPLWALVADCSHHHLLFYNNNYQFPKE